MPWEPDYITLAGLKDFLSIDPADTTDDAYLTSWCSAASRAVDKATNRQFGQVPAAIARIYRRPAVWSPRLGLHVLQIDDVQDTTGLTVNGIALASSGAVMLPDDATIKSRPYTAIGWAYTSPPTVGVPTATIVGKWGWTAVPAAVVQAAYLQANRWNARRRSPFGIAGSPDQGSELRLLARLDPDVVTTIAAYVRARRPA